MNIKWPKWLTQYEEILPPVTDRIRRTDGIRRVFELKAHTVLPRAKQYLYKQLEPKDKKQGSGRTGWRARLIPYSQRQNGGDRDETATGGLNQFISNRMDEIVKRGRRTFYRGKRL